MRLRAAACLLLLAGACSAPAANARFAGYDYDVVLQDSGAQLDVRLSLPGGPPVQLVTAPAAMAFVVEAEDHTGGMVRPLARQGDAYVLPGAASAREVRWRFLARDAGVEIDDVELAAMRGGHFLGSLGAFLLRPIDDSGEAKFLLRVDGGGRRFVCAAAAAGDGWVGAVADLRMQPPCAFGTFAHRTLKIGEASIEIADLAPRSANGIAALDGWVVQAGEAVREYCGGYPVPRVLLVITPGRRRSITGGSARGLGGGARIFVDVPVRFGADDFRGDWVLFHEMVHLALPSLAPRHHWLEEGSATYIEPQLQARAGRLTEVQVWSAMLDEYEQGLAAAGAGGLDDDRSWGRTYYGGAIFCLRADVEIRRRTDNRKSLQDAMRAIVAAGGNISATWPIEQVLETGDAATGTTVLTELYASMRHTAEPRELHSLWRELGVRLEGGRAVFDEAAPLAAVRRALVLGR